MLRTLSQRAVAAESACRNVARVGRATGAATRQSLRPGWGEGWAVVMVGRGVGVGVVGGGAPQRAAAPQPSGAQSIPTAPGQPPRPSRRSDVSLPQAGVQCAGRRHSPGGRTTLATAPPLVPRTQAHTWRHSPRSSTRSRLARPRALEAPLSPLALRRRRRPSWRPRWRTRCARGAGRARRCCVARRARTLQPPCNPPRPSCTWPCTPVPCAPAQPLHTPVHPTHPSARLWIHPGPILHPPCTGPAPTLHRPCTGPAPRRAALRRSGCSRSCRVRRSTERRIRSRARGGRTWRRFAAHRSARHSAPSLRWRTRRCGTRWRRSTSRTSHSRCAEKPTLRRCCATKHHLNVAPAPALILAASKSPSLPPSLPLSPPTWPQLLPHSRPHLRQARRGGARVCTRRTEPLPRQGAATRRKSRLGTATARCPGLLGLALRPPGLRHGSVPRDEPLSRSGRHGRWL